MMRCTVRENEQKFSLKNNDNKQHFAKLKIKN